LEKRRLTVGAVNKRDSESAERRGCSAAAAAAPQLAADGFTRGRADQKPFSLPPPSQHELLKGVRRGEVDRDVRAQVLLPRLPSYVK